MLKSSRLGRLNVVQLTATPHAFLAACKIQPKIPWTHTCGGLATPSHYSYLTDNGIEFFQLGGRR
jgi:hypothetical protein